MTKKNILIIQGEILHYRKALYNTLSNAYNVTVIHSGEATKTREDLYSEVIISCYKLGPFYFQPKVIGEVIGGKYDAVVAMFDLRWLSNIVTSFINGKSKFVWWGPWITNKQITDRIRLSLMLRDNNSILYTTEAKEEFIDRGISRDKLFVANNTFDVGERQRSFDSSTKSTFIFVGSLDSRKQLELTLRAFSKIVTQVPDNIVFEIIGDGKEIDNIKNIVSELKIEDHVSFLGRINCVEMLKKHYETAYFSVSFGQAGLSVLQSLGYGVPFITKHNAISGGEKSNIIDGYNGYQCKDDVDVLASHMKKLLVNDKLARTMGENAFNYYSEHATIQNMADGFVDAIESKQVQ
ncbi:glycosyltransferase family 4 protein [Enterovibrio calviensis]|uniref:glycosyltransferase family 4 protein n=1 Tax=Enterovibrio calviensis TaxID=91359 RepID=UPI0037362039